MPAREGKKSLPEGFLRRASPFSPRHSPAAATAAYDIVSSESEESRTFSRDIARAITVNFRLCIARVLYNAFYGEQSESYGF